MEVYLVEVVPSYAHLESQNQEITVKVVSANLMVVLHLKYDKEKKEYRTHQQHFVDLLIHTTGFGYKVRQKDSHLICCGDMLTITEPESL